MAAGISRQNKAHKAMNRPLTILGAERRLFFVALIAGGAVFSLMHSLLGGILLLYYIMSRYTLDEVLELLLVLGTGTIVARCGGRFFAAIFFSSSILPHSLGLIVIFKYSIVKCIF